MKASLKRAIFLRSPLIPATNSTVVRVLIAGTSTLATLYANSDGSGDTLSNPTNCNTYGELDVFVAPGLYDLVVTDGSLTRPYYNVLATNFHSHTPSTISASSYTLLKTDIDKWLRFTHSSNCAFTVPAFGSTAGVHDSDEFHGRAAGAGTVTITPASGVTINQSALATYVVSAGQSFSLKCIGPDLFDLIM